MKRETVVILLVLILIFGFFVLPVSSAPDHLPMETTSRNRAILVVGSDQTYTTIDAAITAAQPGDTIRVHAGTYGEGIVLNKMLKLEGNGSINTIIAGGGTKVPLDIQIDNCEVTGFTIKGSSGSATDAGIVINSSFNNIWNCNISSNQGNGVRMESSGSNNTVENCLITDNGRHGIKIISSNTHFIKSCTIKYNEQNGIDLQNTDGNTIENNTISDSKGVSQAGIAFSSGDANIIQFNDLRNDLHGILVSMGSSNIITCNTIVYQSSTAIDFGGASSSNIVHHNNFIDCNPGNKQADDGGSNNLWDDGYPSGGNYWSDWTTPDTQSGTNQDQVGSDGIVDNPYNLLGNTDNYPLTDPFVILTITTADIETATEDVQYSATYNAWTNIINSTLTWSLSTNASWLSRTGSTIQGTPENSHVGSYWVDISVSDGANQDAHNFTLNVINVNDDPVINTTNVETVNETEPYYVDYEAYDIDPTNDTFTWAYDTDATFLSMDPGTGVLSGTPSRSELGSYFVNVSVTDGNGGKNSSYFILTVLNLNDPPEILTPDNPTAYELQLYSVDYEANDIDPTNDILAWDVDTNATFLDMDSSTGVLSGTPSRNDLGGYFVNVTVNDSNGGWDYSNFTLTVLNVNDGPGINNSWANFSFDEDTVNENISLNDWFMDYDNDKLTFDYSGNEKLSVTILTTGIVRLVPEANWSGYEILTFYANDTLLEVSDSVNITVLPVNDAPYNVEINTALANLTEGGNQTVLGIASDVDIPYGDMLTYSWSTDISGPLGTGNELNLSLDAGVYKLTLNVSDSAGAWVEVSKDIEIVKPKKEPVINQSDKDGDGLPDDWENNHFGDITSNDGDDDPDMDTFNNTQEWENGTNPNDREDYPGKIEEPPDDDDDDSDTSFMTDYWWIIPLIIFIILFLLILLLIVTRRKKEEEEEVVGELKEFECPTCGAIVSESEAVCPECGSEFEEEIEGEEGEGLPGEVEPVEEGELEEEFVPDEEFEADAEGQDFLEDGIDEELEEGDLAEKEPEGGEVVSDEELQGEDIGEEDIEAEMDKELEVKEREATVEPIKPEEPGVGAEQPQPVEESVPKDNLDLEKKESDIKPEGE
jgi:parallel beta-helix repeat protein